MSTANCLRNEWNQQTLEAQLKEVANKTSSCDASLNLIQDENNRLEKTID
jgi:septal ring factor EnvC (AmiA/AmiB activator)